MLYIDISYLKQLSYRLEGFKQKRFTPFLATCRCSLCGDSTKKKNKKRGYFYEKKGSIIYHCFNCNASISFGNFLKDFDRNMFDQYTLERYKSGATHQHTRKDKDVADMFKIPPSTRKYIPTITDDLKSIAELADDHPAKQYVAARLLPKDMWDKLFYAPKFYKWAAGHTDRFNAPSKADHPRMIIPWYSADGVLFAYTARSFGGEEPKYYKIILDETVKPQVFGLNRTEKVEYVVEGPIDSMFLPNSIAVGNAALHMYDCDGIYITDRDVRNKEIMREAKLLINMGKKVCMLPNNIIGKDLNDMVQNGLTVDDIHNIIKRNTYHGLEAQLKFSEWSKTK